MRKIRFNKKKITIFLIFIGGAFFGTTVGAFFALTHDLPQIRSLETFNPSAVTRIYSSDKVLLAELYAEKRDPVPFKNIPFYLKEALIATEDRSFYRHSGVDLKGILRAIIKDIWAGEYVEGASTITQQLAKTLFLSPRKTLIRKIKEAILAFQLERRYTKDEILELYLNQIYFGSGAYGVESAARTFFRKSAKDLSLAECALIAGLPKSPSRYSPLNNHDLSIKRRNIVLKQMRETDIITEAAYNNAIEETISHTKQNKNFLKAPYFVDHVKKFLENSIGSSLLYKSGLTVFTTLSFNLQKAAEQALKNGLLDLEIRMKQKGIRDPNPQAGLVVLDVKSGGILAMAGGKDYYNSPFNRATSAKRQPGSAFKPIVYAHAIEQGFPQNMMILDAPVAFKGIKKGKEWRPENFSRKYKGEMTLRNAIAVSQNIPAVRLIEMLGPSSVVQFGYSLGIESTLLPNLSLALGTSEITLIEMVSAFSVFPNRGEQIKPFAVKKVLGDKGRIVWRTKPVKKVAMSRSGAAIMTNILQGVINEGTGRKAKSINHPVAGKTGTSNDFKDALFIGFSPAIASGVWVGIDDSTSLGKWETGSRAALPIWVEFMKKALENEPYQYFDIPDDVAMVMMDPLTGLLVPEGSSHGVKALFKKGTEPRKYR